MTHPAIRGASLATSNGVLYAYVEYADELVAKALAISEVAQIARAEVRVNQYLLTQWRVRSKQATNMAATAAAGGSAPARIHKIVDSVMSLWADDVKSTYATALSKVYTLARTAGHKKATGKTTRSLQYVIPDNATVQKAKPRTEGAISVRFDLVDKKTIATLQKQEMLWIGEHYGSHVSEAIRDGVNAKLLTGVGRVEAGKLVRGIVEDRLAHVAVPGGWRGSDAAYFEGLAANAVTNARVQGQIESFSRVKVTTYELVNPMDDRTTLICNDLNGMTFNVSDAMAHLGKLRGATTPDQVRAVHPWIGDKGIRQLKERGGAKALTAAGQLLPPFHFRCRTTVDIAAESYTYSPVEE